VILIAGRGRRVGNTAHRPVLEAKSGPISDDIWIAAHAKAAGLMLTKNNNEREFKRAPGLSVENWTT